MATALQVAAARIRFDARQQFIALAAQAAVLDAELIKAVHIDREAQHDAVSKRLRPVVQLSKKMVKRLRKAYPGISIHEPGNLVYGLGRDQESLIGPSLSQIVPTRQGMPRKQTDGYGRQIDSDPDFNKLRQFVANIRKLYRSAPVRSVCSRMSDLIDLAQQRYESATIPENEIIALAGQAVTIEDQDNPAKIVEVVTCEMARLNRKSR